MTKPTTVPEWATSPPTGRIVTPTAGKIASGFAPEEKPPAEIVNERLNLLGQWAKYLSDGALEGSFALASAISPSAITGTVNDYDPTDLATAQVIRQDLSANTTLTGLVGGSIGRLILLQNIDPSFRLTLSHEDTASVAANRFSLPEGGQAPLPPGGSALLCYDTTSSRWRLLASSGLAGGEVSTNIGTTENDWDGGPTLLGSGSHVLINPSDTTCTITGIGIGQVAGRRLILTNTDTAQTIVLAHEGAGSAAANRFDLVNDTNLTIPPGGTVEIIYDGANSRWRVIGLT